MINSFSPTAFISGTTFDAMYANALNITEIIAALRSAPHTAYTDDQIVEYLCGHCYADFAQTLVNADYNTFLHLMSMTHAWAFDQLLIHLNINQMGWPLDKQIDVIMAQMTVVDLVTFLEPYLQCQDWAMIYGMRYTSGSVESTNLLLSIPGIKDCIKNAFTQHEIMDALVLHLGVVNTWTIIFQTEPGTENSYLPALRNANKRLFLYQSMLLLNSNSNMRYYIENHTEPNTTVAEWKATVKKSFGLNYYNDMLLEISEQYATFYWVYELQEQYMYGSSRLGSVQRNLPLVQQVLNSDSLLYYSYSNDSIRYMDRGQKRLELSNHLGNVLAVVSDRKLVHCSNDELMWFDAQVVSVTDYYPFGMEIKERTYVAVSASGGSAGSGYRYGFNGMEKDNEVKGDGNSLDFGARIYDSRLGRWMSVDPQTGKFPYESPYVFVSDNPIIYVDPNGEAKYITFIEVNEQTGESTEISVLVDADLLEAVQVRTTSSLSPHTLGPIEYDYYDINEVHTTVIKSDGTKIVERVKTERGEYRAHTAYKSEYWANVFKVENEFEEKAKSKMTGIRWTTSKKNAEGQGNSFESGRTFTRSENIDMLISVLKFTKSTASGSAKNITKASKSLKDVLEKVKAVKTAKGTPKTIKTLYDEVNEADKYDANDHTCSSCPLERHDNLGYEDSKGNKMNGQGDTLQKAK